MAALLAVGVVGVAMAVLSLGAGSSGDAPVAASGGYRATPGLPAARAVVLPAGGVAEFDNPSVACTGPGSCVLVGAYTGKRGTPLPMVATETRGVWGAAQMVMPPADAATNSYQLAVLQSVVCTAVGECSAVGEYTDTSHANKPMAVTATHGVWGRARNVRLPGSADIPHGGLPQALSSLACSSRGDCEAIVDYNPDAPGPATVATETAGVWRQATQISPPMGTSFAVLDSLACTTPGDCVAVGTADNRPMLAVQTHGAWAPARAVAPPAGVHFTSNEGVGHLFSVACPSAGNCVAVGNYGATDGAGVMAVSETHGHWRRAQRVPLPADGSSTRQPAPVLDLLLAVACTSAGKCAAVGTYGDVRIGFGANGQPMTASDTNGTWRRAVQVNLPRGAYPAPPTETSSLTTIACPRPTGCVAAGFYDDTRQQTEAMLLSERGP